MYTVELKSCGNVDYNQDPNKPMYGCEPDQYKPVKSFKEASEAVKEFINKNRLGSGNWVGGLVRKKGIIVADVSYNGRVWELNASMPRYSNIRTEIKV
jgi:hypothetical protein